LTLLALRGLNETLSSRRLMIGAYCLLPGQVPCWNMRASVAAVRPAADIPSADQLARGQRVLLGKSR
jgi:hypothetical protein